MLKLRRGLLTAGLAVTVVGALGVAAMVDAEATPVTAATGSQAADSTPPALLPWGEKPSRIRTGKAGMSSEELRAAGLSAALDPRGATEPVGRYAPKGRPGVAAETAKSTTLAAATSYFYNFGRHVAVTDGYYANLSIAKPRLHAKDAHSLAELAVQSGDSKQIVEVGWTVDRAVNNGSEEPHLFVYHWVNGKTSCYNGCGWVQTHPTVKPGAKLATGAKRFGIQFVDDAWWISYDSEFIGYFPEKLWTEEGGVESFRQTGLVQLFGEVAGSANPCSQMGNGLPGKDPGAAVIGSISYLNGPVVALDLQSTSSHYTVNLRSARTFQYGGTPSYSADSGITC
ncbi:neprosin family prolyl endopeptidase [Paractinoplanes rishiriensis]|uniref:Neprosin PEP catalytic domain-containing protein n=1 Tax=Paractinoplanes rishiriensis TaxID=1050105 RepID=A0A919K2G9_9ACTN|nr:neprosin family prolyl endopeptidase [Actinoplanes rishiriensis]GIE95411.1 hypothetical protein Ari01nite_28760 [Actinoplanes rishiriensis]